MTTAALAAAVIIGCLAAIPLRAADDLIERLTTCQSSWLDWKNDPAQLKQLGETFQAAFVQKKSEPFFVPKAKASVIGLPIAQVFPESLGMGVGFSVTVSAVFDTTKAALEKATGKKFAACDRGEGMRHCELGVAQKRTLMLMAADSATSKTSLFGCYYYYEK